MRTSRVFAVVAWVAFLLLGPAVSQAFAISIRDLVALSREGVSDPVLVALIETDGSRFTLKADDIRSLKADGLSDTVIVAMIKTARPTRDNNRPIPDAEPSLYTPTPTQEPAQVHVNQTVTQKVSVPQPIHEYTPVYVPVYIAVPTHPVELKKEEPVYWGWGGKRRPDAWKDPEPVQPTEPVKPTTTIKK